MTHLHANFLESPRTYEQARCFWRSIWEDAQSQHGLEWQVPWLSEPPAALQDGNPIFTAWSPQLRRAVRVIQRTPISGIPDLSYWLDVFGGELHEPDAVEELVVSCAPAVELVPELSAVLSDWISGRPLSVSIEAPQLMTESRQLVIAARSRSVDEAA